MQYTCIQLPREWGRQAACFKIPHSDVARLLLRNLSGGCLATKAGFDINTSIILERILYLAL